MSIRALFLASVAIATMSTPVLAQAVAELEGKVTLMPMTGTGPATTITSLKIFNSNIALKPTTTFATPTRDGMTANDIGVAESTVKVHRTHLMRKMKARSLPELSRMADILKLALEKPQRS